MTQTFRFETMPARMLSGLLVLPLLLHNPPHIVLNNVLLSQWWFI